MFFFIPRFRRRRVVYVERTCASQDKVERPGWAAAGLVCVVIGVIGIACTWNYWVTFAALVLALSAGVMGYKPYPVPPFLPRNERMWHSDRR
jgi:hypothetical protein